MEKLICQACSAPLAPTTQTPFLTCEYCGTAVPNPYYDESAAKAEAGPQKPDEMCVELLIEMGTGENLHKVSGLLAGAHFGNPLDGSWLADQARKTMNIPDAEKIYLVYDATLIGTATDGFALADGGLYAISSGDTTRRSWETFITGRISCVDGTSRQQPGTLKIGSGLAFAVSNEDDSRLAQFVVEFHNQAYRRYTGDSAPAAWRVTQQQPSQPSQPSAVPFSTQRSSGVGGSLLNAAGTLLAGALLNGGRTSVHRPVVQRTVVQRAARPAQPAARRAARVQQQPRPARPAGGPPPRKPAHGTPRRPGMPGSISRMGGGAAPRMNAPAGRRPSSNKSPLPFTKGPGHKI